LSSDIGHSLSNWANIVFGLEPDAINFWMGDNRAVSSLHLDYYENIYCVVTGKKHFTLLPPTDLCYLYKQPYKSATFHQESGNWKIRQDEPHCTVPWVPVDPDNPDLNKYPKAKNIRPLNITVNAGEVLYLPSLVFHKVSQTGDEEGKTIAINYWYDMQYDLKFNYYKFMENLIPELQLSTV